MTNKEIAGTLKEIGALIELSGGNPFRARAYQNAARTIQRLDEPLESIDDIDTLRSIPGVGDGLAEQIRELAKTGTISFRDELRASLPPGILELTGIRGLGAKKIRQLWNKLGVTSIDQLEHAARSGRVARLAGFGEKTQRNILDAIEQMRAYNLRRRFDIAFELTAPILEHLRLIESVRLVEAAGELRRRMETVDMIEIVVAGHDAHAVRNALSPWLVGEQPGPANEITFGGKTSDGFDVRVHFTGPERAGTSLWRHTGSEQHLHQFEARYGPVQNFPSEQEIYASRGLPFIEPELREGAGEIEAAAAGNLPELISLGDLKGTIHNHSNWSDGVDSLEQMARTAREIGFSYFGISDHSRSLSIANGLSIDEVRSQQKEILALNEAYSGTEFRIFSGIESDILPDGSLDYPDDVLSSFDFVVASVHSGFDMTREEATRRIVRAIENPYTTILGHATGRLLLQREGYPLDTERVIAACARHGVAIEINANPRRLDLDWRWIREATRQGVLISINPDAHAVDQLHHMHWGVGVARKGWLTPAQCLNARTLEAFTAWLEARRLRRPART